MQPDDVTDLIIAMILLVFLSSAVWALQSPIGEVLVGEGLSREAKITADTYNYNFQENIFLLNYLRTPMAKLTVADYVLMCDSDKFDDLIKETDRIVRDYYGEVNIVVICNNERKLVFGNLISDDKSRTSLFLNKEKGVEIKIYPKGTLGLSGVSYSKPFGG